MVQDKNSFAVQFYSESLLVFSSVKEGEDAFSRIEVALDSLGRQKPIPDSGSTPRHQLTSTSPELSLIGGASIPAFHHDSDSSEAQILSELITSCVATWLMIQMCTERQYPPSDVAQILDSAVRSLQPSCPQNLGVYREIQMSMGRIKTQILALRSPEDNYSRSSSAFSHDKHILHEIETYISLQLKKTSA
ncbi:hypothetical protein LguiB_021141 [Lonicera macranthoides]